MCIKGILSRVLIDNLDQYPQLTVNLFSVGNLVDIDQHLIHISVKSQLIFADMPLGFNLSLLTLNRLSIGCWLSVG